MRHWRFSHYKELADHLGCDPQTRFFVPPNIKQWIALLQRGNCTFKEKISRAAFHNAVAVVIYNNKSKEEPVTMTHPAWLIFYFIQKIRYTNARDRNQRRLGDAAKKAISKLTTRTVKKGDKETDPDFDHCAVCIESYKQNDVVRVLPCKYRSKEGTSLIILVSLSFCGKVADTAPEEKDGELTPRTGEINIAVTKSSPPTPPPPAVLDKGAGGHFFHRNSLSPRSLVYESEFSTIEPSLDMINLSTLCFKVISKTSLRILKAD
ncbi:hypothetical protein A6R68_14614 [Neotoma lepida]|uniref:PA domain-containing protein n=1 Tax=Neotoma lepida TaxID=56216 RepID=A0A1A6H965_NEOLE|nr:hypothetical protein A6R68_14614 [Neotoma lepida]